MESAKLSNGKELSFSPGEIVLLVGPNNSGKSTFLNELFGFLENSHGHRRLLKELSINYPDSDYLMRQIKKVLTVAVDKGSNLHYVLRPNGDYHYALNLHGISNKSFSLGRAAKAFAVKLDAETRLSLSKPTDTIDISFDKARHPYHAFMLDRGKLREFSKIICDAFGYEFSITRIGNPIRGYIAHSFNGHEDSLEADKEIPASGEPLEIQGDGIRSYVGIASELVVSPYPIILLDEPEAFLHPPQARKLGQLFIQKLENNCQAFVATHSSDFLQGILHAKDSRVRVIRLDRTSGDLGVNVLDNDRLSAAISHPSIANTNLLDSLFFSQTVICEGDSDCSLLDWSIRELGDPELKGVDRFWFSLGGKHQAPKISALLTAFGVDFRVILDLDAISDWDLIKSLAAQKGLDISSFKKRIMAALSVLSRPQLGAISGEILEAVGDGVFKSDSEEKTALGRVKRALEGAKNSSALKTQGLLAFRKGQEWSDVSDFLSRLRNVGIILLSRGEIESYVPGVGDHGPGWASGVLEKREEHESELLALLGEIRQGLL